MSRTRRQHFGQHFLSSPGHIRQILDAAFTPMQSDRAPLLEIGPGEGALTLECLKRLESDRPFWIVEKDPRLIENFWSQQTLPQNATLVHSDFLEWSLPEALLSQKFWVLSNLPYSVGTAIVLRLSTLRAHILGMTLMFQKEVGDRIVATEEDSERGSLSVWLQNDWAIKRILKVPPGAFAPPPKVDSVVLSFTPRLQGQIAETEIDRKILDTLLRASFGNRRKMIRKTLGDLPERAGLNPALRPEKLQWEDWKKLVITQNQTRSNN